MSGDGVDIHVNVDGKGTDTPKKVAGGIEGLVKRAKQAVPALLLLNSTLGESNGLFSKAVRSISGAASAFAAFGPGGAIVAAAKAGMDAIAGYFIDAADKALAKAKELGAKMTGRLEKMKELRLNHLADDMARVAKRADEVAAKFDRAAAAREKMSVAARAAAGSREEAELSGMRGQMAADVAAVGDEDAGRVEAAWRLKIAEREAEVKMAAAKREEDAEAEGLRTAEKRAAISESNAKKLEAAAVEAMARYDQMRDLFGETDPGYVNSFKRVADAAKSRADAAHRAAEDDRLAAEAAQAQAEAAARRRQTGINEAFDRRDEAVWAYDRAERDHARAIEAAESGRAAKAEEQNRLEMERRIAAERKRLERQIADERAAATAEDAAAQMRLARAEARSAQAWGWYRNRDSLKAQIEEEKADAIAERQFEKDFDRLRSFRRDWRTASNLNLDQEATRRVGLAREEEAAARRWAEETAENTRRTAEAAERVASELDGGEDL